VKLYKIRNWDQHFENNRTREMKRLGWVPVPNKQDGDGFCAIMHHEDGLKIFGAWVLLLQVASKCSPRGTLVRDNGMPHTERTIARMTGAQEGDIYIAMQYLASSDVDWLCYDHVEIPQEGAGSPQEGAGIPQEPAENALERKGTEQKGNEQKGAAAPLAPPPSAKKGQTMVEPTSGPAFEAFWVAYPSGSRVDRKACLKKWKDRNLDAIAPQIMSGLAAWKESSRWTKDDGQFIPNSTTWLNQSRWETSPAPSAPDYDPDAPGMMFPKKSPEEIARICREVEGGQDAA
jgi:hypothetical protein